MQSQDAGKVQSLAPGLRGILAPNPGPMTLWGTNTFLIGETEVAVVDPGPADAGHIEAIVSATQGQRITHILVTHAHLDHSPGAKILAAKTGASIYGFGTADAGRRPVMRNLLSAGLTGGGEGVDSAFSPDCELSEGDQLCGPDWLITTLHTPGHFAGHLSFQWEEHLISGDHVMDWSSSLVSPPDGDLRSFMETSRKLIDLKGLTFHPAHGATIHTPTDRLEWLIAHRLKRETEILNVLSQKPQTIRDIAQRVYADIPKEMLRAAERNVFAHLIDLVERKSVTASPELSVQATYTLQ